MKPETLPTLADFLGAQTVAGRKRHLALRTWQKATLCGMAAMQVWELSENRWLGQAECKQCIKSRNRQMEGRPH